MRANQNRRKGRRASSGFSTIELMIVLLIGLIISAIALPQVMASYQNFKLNQAANSVAGVLKFTKFQAVRENAGLNFCTSAGVSVTLYTDDSEAVGCSAPVPPGPAVARPDGAPYTDHQTVVNAPITLNSPAVPGGLGAAICPGCAPAPALTTIASGGGTLQFTARGGLGNAFPGAYVMYLNNASAAAAGFRAIVVMPSGAVHEWDWLPGGGAAPARWQQVN